nr:thioredoxin reductase 1, cytoplasmic-like [Equus caballus]
MGCAKSKETCWAARRQQEAVGPSCRAHRSSAKDHLRRQTLPENPATGVSGPSGSTSVATADPQARLQACIDSHPVVVYSKSARQRCAENEAEN